MNIENCVLEIDGLTIGLPGGSDRGDAVSDISLTVAAGQTVCLVGESGSGKSVIAKGVMGLLPHSLPIRSGRILLNGENIAGASDRRLRELRAVKMSMVFQEPMTALNPVIKCGEQIEEVLREHTSLSGKERRARVLSAIEEVLLPDPERIYQSYPHQLSGGQRQRIVIAMAIVLEPRLLIADEPTTALDVTTQAQILKLIKALQTRHGTGVLFITHDFGVVADIADRVVVMKLGEMIEQGCKDEVLRNPSQSYTRMLIGSVPRFCLDRKDPAISSTDVLHVEGLNKRYAETSFSRKKRTVHAVDDVSFKIPTGSTVGIVGESGSGKSTVARCIARLIDPTSGSVVLAGHQISKLSMTQLRPLRRKVQFVFQDPNRSLNPRLSVGDSLSEGLLNIGVSKEDALDQAVSMLSLVRLDASALARFPHQFSGGQRQRICIARALLMKPDLLIADEAVSALDVSVQAQVLELLKEIRSKLNLSMLFITHDLRVASQICDYVIVMSKGKVVEQGSSHEVFSSPKKPYTQGLLQAAPGRGFEFLAH